MFGKIKFEYRITITYLIIGFLWIFFSDKFLETFFSIELLAKLQTVKGLFYIIATAYIFYYFVKSNEEKRNKAKTELTKLYKELLTSEEELTAGNEVLAATTDALKENLKELEIAKAKAEESDRLKSAFLQNLSHEVRTPLNAIAGFTKLIADNSIDEAKREQYSKIISDSSNQLINIITDLIEISQIQTKQAKARNIKIDLIQFFEPIETVFLQKCETESLTFRVTKKFEAGTVISTDNEKLRRIITHLLDNALKFTPSGTVWLNYETNNNQLLVEVNDTGIGISPEMQKVIFEPFRQVELGIVRNFGGNGLGLALVKAYIQLLGGSIVIHSEIDKGTKVSLRFPLN